MFRERLLGAGLAVLLAAAVPFVPGAAAAGPGVRAPARAATCADGAVPFVAGGDLARARAAVTCLVNADRAARGLPTLSASPLLDEAARLHGQWMATTQVIDHVESGPGARPQPWDRAAAAGYAYAFVGENLAAGQPTPADVVQGWLRSVGHCENLRSPQPLDIGLYVTTDPIVHQGAGISPVWTLVLGRQAGVAVPSADTSGQAACTATVPSLVPPQAGGAAADFGGSTTGRASRVKVTAVGAKRRATFTIRARTGKRPARGKVLIAADGRVLEKARLSRRGTVTVTVRKQPRGERTYTVVYLGNKRTRAAQRSVDVRVR
ncbi:CAP domain-containing protein [Nocardioides sp. L-11A]|uniref:CAP domain-containing protein n=1 Tax=Nocardioides sp. L-11A TaxID=3043848 RepID=UPI00249BC1D2|nr:CAP domain-containing protein [Nocardioides sp. L-11A]